MTAVDKVNILIIEKCPLMLMSTEEILAELGENLITASSTSEAMKVLETTDIAVVVMTESHLEAENYELAAAIRHGARFQETAIIFVCDANCAGFAETLRYGRSAVDIISARVGPEVLRVRIRMFVEQHRRMLLLKSENRELKHRVATYAYELAKCEAEFDLHAELLNIATEAIMVRGLDDTIQFWSPGAESLYGWRRDEVLGKDLHSVLRTVFPEPRGAIDRALREHGEWRGNLIQRAKDGSEVVVACRKSMNHTGSAVLEVGRDITAELRAEDQMRESDKLATMGRVAGIIAHEINNPLAAIANLLYLVRNHPSLDAEARQCADLAEEQLNRVSYITRQTLSFYRESRHPVPVRIAEILEDVLGLQEHIVKTSRIVLDKRYSMDAEVQGFPGELRQVFLNLVSNAIQAMPDGGALGIHVSKATDWTTQHRGIMISVIDTGMGVEPKDAHRLFEPFFSTKATKGTGLGLWISKGIVQKYDGRISFRSYRYAGGCTTCFRVFLPANGAHNPTVEDVVVPTHTKSAEKMEAPLIHSAEMGIAYGIPSNA